MHGQQPQSRTAGLKQVVPVLRAFRILELFHGGKSLSVTEISRALDLPKSSTHDILATLEAAKVVERDGASARFELGIKLIELGNRARHEYPLNRVAAPFLKALNRAFDETVYLTVLDGEEVFYADCHEPTRMLRAVSSIGDRAPLYCTAVGKAILAFLPPEDIRRIVDSTPMERFTANTITRRETLLEELGRVAARGYSVDDMEHEDGVRCVGAPLRNAEGRVFAAISISGPAQRVTPAREAEIAEHVMATARSISASLGWRSAPAGGPELIRVDGARERG